MNAVWSPAGQIFLYRFSCIYENNVKEIVWNNADARQRHPSNGVINLQREWMPRLMQKLREGQQCWQSGWLSRMLRGRECQRSQAGIAECLVPWCRKLCALPWNDGYQECSKMEHPVVCSISWKVLENIKKGWEELYSDNSIQNRNE